MKTEYVVKEINFISVLTRACMDAKDNHSPVRQKQMTQGRGEIIAGEKS